MKRLFWAAMGVALISMVFAGCKKDEPTYMVQVTAAEGGIVEGQSGEYKEGETVVFTAVPAEDYYFTQWSDGSTENPRTVTISNAAITLTAEFVQKPLLTISTSDNGTIETDVNGHYAIGSSVTVTAKPDDGCFFMGWSDGNTDNPRTITIGNKDVRLTALFFAPTVDLGLESGTLWASCNLGAATPLDKGDYYAWGETETKDDYSWETYKYCKGTNTTLTKYCFDAEWGNDGYTDTLTILLPEDDAATVVLGSDYSIPTIADWKELRSQCYWEFTTDYNGTDKFGYIVYKVKSAGDKGVLKSGTNFTYTYTLKDTHIFLRAPSVSFRDFWSASLFIDEFDKDRAYSFGINDFTGTSIVAEYRAKGLPIRPVKRP